MASQVSDSSETGSPEAKNERFTRLAEQRVNAILDKLRLLGQLSNRRNYVYSEEQAASIFRAIQKELNSTRAKFRDDSNEVRKFKL